MSNNKKKSDIPPLKDQIYHTLKTQIITGELIPGEIISVQDISEINNVSRTPVEQAMRALVSEGLLVNSKRRGRYVKTFSEKDLKDHMEAENLLISIVSNSICFPLSTANTLQQIAAEYDLAALRCKKNHAMITIENKFITQLVSGCDNHVLSGIPERIRDNAQIISHLLYKDISHRSVVSESLHQYSDALSSEDMKSFSDAVETYFDYMDSRISKIAEIS